MNTELFEKILNLKNLRSSEKWILTISAVLADEKRIFCISIQELAKLSNLSEKSIERILSLLRMRNIFIYTNKFSGSKGRIPVYEINIDNIKDIPNYNNKEMRDEYKMNRAAYLDFITKRDGYKCNICSNLEKLTIDHIIPITKNGTNDLNNLQLLCLICNSVKGNR
jgi:transcription initiation factor IIE alpha subunit